MRGGVGQRRRGSGGTHLVDGRLLDESRGLAGQDAVRRHDEDLVGSSFLQSLGRRHKTVHVVDDVVLRPRHFFYYNFLAP